MAIEFACRCGKGLRAAVEHAGKSARCSQCGRIVMIPAATPEDDEADGPMVAMAGMAGSSDLNDLFPSERPPGEPEALASAFLSPTPAPAKAVATSHRQCPNCQSPLVAAAILCVHCGYNLNTGTRMTTVSSKEVETHRPHTRSKVYELLVSRLTSWKLWSGLGMMAVAGLGLLCFAQGDIVGRRGGRAFAALFVLFLTGGITFVNGLCDGDDA